MSTWFSRLKELYEGKKQIGQKVAKDGVVPAATGTDDLFVVSGGRVRLVELLGQVTVLVDVAAHTAINIKLTHTPTTGALAPVDMCAVLNCATDDVDTLYSIPGGGGAMVDDARAGVAVPSFGTNQLDLQPGTVKLDLTDAGGIGGCAGEIVWTLFYVPIDDGAVITAAP
jgi:hypothetical protein